MQGEQPCVAGACADKDDFAFCRAEAVKLRGKLCFGGIEVALCGERVKAAVEQVFPKTAAVCRAFDFGFDRVAPFAGECRHLTGVQRDERFDDLPPLARQNGGGRAAGDGDFERAAVDDGGDGEGTQIRGIDSVAEFRPLLRRLEDAAVEGVIVGGGDGEKHVIQIVLVKFAAQPFDFAFVRPFLENGIEFAGDNPDRSPCLQQAFGFAFRHFARTRQQDGAAVQIGKQGIMVHGVFSY